MSSLDNYSVLNNYNYNNKPFIVSALDWLSTPCRRVLGGKNYCVLSHTTSHEMTTARKVATLFFSILIFPVAVISIASLIIKISTFPYIWEKRKVQAQSNHTWKLIHQFKNAYNRKNYDDAIQTFQQNPNIGKRNDVNNTLFRIINRKINMNTSWDNVQKLLPLLSTPDAIELINHTVKINLSNEMKNDCFLTDANDIMRFIQNSLKCKSISNLETCYKKLFTNALKVDVNDNMILNLIRMEIADQMIQSLTRIKKANAENRLQYLSAEINETELRHSIFDKNQDYVNLFLTFQQPKKMKKIGATIEKIRIVCHAGSSLLNKINSFSYNSKEQLNHIQSEFKKFKKNLEALTFSGDEKTYVKAFLGTLNNLVQLIDGIDKKISIDDYEKIANTLQEDYKNQNDSLKNILDEYKKINPLSIDIYSILELKNKAYLFISSEKIVSAFLKKMEQIVLEKRAA